MFDTKRRAFVSFNFDYKFCDGPCFLECKFYIKVFSHINSYTSSSFMSIRANSHEITQFSFSAEHLVFGRKMTLSICRFLDQIQQLHEEGKVHAFFSTFFFQNFRRRRLAYWSSIPKKTALVARIWLFCENRKNRMTM